MANVPVPGSQVSLQYGWESTFGSASSSINKAFSHGVKITSYDIDNSYEPIFGIGSQEATAAVVKEFKGSIGLEFPLTDPWWLRAILGGAPVDAGATPYTHTWTIGNSGILNTLPSLTLDMGFDYATTDSQHTILGAVAKSVTISGSVNEKIMVKLDLDFANVTKDTSPSGSYTAPVESPFIFGNATIEFPSSTTISGIQSFELTLNRNTQMGYQVGSRFPYTAYALQREYSFRATSFYYKDTDFLDSALGGSGGAQSSVSEVASLKITITNGLAGANERSYTFTLANCTVEKISIPSSVDDAIKQEVNIRARGITSVAVNNNTSAAL